MARDRVRLTCSVAQPIQWARGPFGVTMRMKVFVGSQHARTAGRITTITCSGRHVSLFAGASEAEQPSTGTPLSASFENATICVSLKFDFRMTAPLPEAVCGVLAEDSFDDPANWVVTRPGSLDDRGPWMTW